MPKRLIFIPCFFYLLFTNSILNAQGSGSFGRDTAKVLMLVEKADMFRFSRPDSCLPLASEALNLARFIGYKKGEALALTSIGEFYRVSGSIPEALEHLFEALRISREINEKSIEGACLTFMGISYITLQEYRTGLDYLGKAYSINKQFPNHSLTAFSLANTGVAYQKLNMLDSALLYQRQAWALGKETKLSAGRAFVLMETGVTYSLMQQYDSAFYYFRYALSVTNDVLNSGRIYSRMAFLYDELGMADSSFYYAKLAMQRSQRSFQKQIMLDASLILAKCYERRGQLDSALKYQHLNNSLKDSLFGSSKLRKLQLLAIEEQRRIYAAEQKQIQIENEQAAYKSRIGLYSLLGISATLLFLGIILYRNNRRKQVANQLLEKQKNETEQTLKELRLTQTQLIQSEKMASLGELTAGIAHEIQNPLNFINNFSEVNKELLSEMIAEIDKGHIAEVKPIASSIIENEEKILYHGKRADAIVKGMLQHSRSSSGAKEPVDINSLVDEYFRLAYHGLRAKDKSFNAMMKTNFDDSLGKINIVPQDIGRVVLNLITNAFYSVTQKKKQMIPGYEPTVTVSTRKQGNKVEIRVKDNGNGVPARVKEKIFQPFFTTKPTGQGTGLGLSLSYDIIKAHGGEMIVESEEGQFAEFIILLTQ